MPKSKRPLNDDINGTRNKRSKQNQYTMDNTSQTVHVPLLSKMSQNRYQDDATAPYIVYVFDNHRGITMIFHSVESERISGGKRLNNKN